MSGFWIQVSPSGHVTGSVYASALAADTEAGAHRRFTPDRTSRATETATGVRHVRLERPQWQQQARPCLLGDCQHTP
ncbi:hypothetical protein [Streptomyces sp. XC 2026]|uniref:hypothetical protein n=1 Tax=Streptomyces sp. XC 2026 TaxID=2782004 RepID=UPI0019087E0E|nr:hypothetical protein [Streptomyces sp. XC 2026]QQN79773.1 hypothetical protein IPZ77_21850 [Streptomyces sp. XC 2026]QQN80619.1 hypothetical protein IPZ77_26805 [Streptomyces sp. XC 2026]